MKITGYSDLGSEPKSYSQEYGSIVRLFTGKVTRRRVKAHHGGSETIILVAGSDVCAHCCI
jgi:hypothetical protein